jgi:hypothetical protein
MLASFTSLQRYIIQLSVESHVKYGIVGGLRGLGVEEQSWSLLVEREKWDAVVGSWMITALV